MQIQTALLWFDDSSRVPFVDKVHEAVEAYQDKFGRPPDVCYVNPQDLPNGLTPPLGVAVEPETSVLRHHFYVGVSGSAR